MKTVFRLLAAYTLSALALSSAADAGAAGASYKHILLISVDGMHAVDLANYADANPDSALASLVHTGVDGSASRG